jgi:hypothetical protein
MKKTSVFALLAALMAAALACGQGTGISSTRVPPPTLIPFKTATATPTVNSICLQVNAGDSSDEIARVAQRLLADLGLAALPPGGDCDATLTFDLSIKALSAYYTGGGTCFTGAKVTGTYTYAIRGYEPRILRVETEIPPTSGIINTCPSPTEAPYADAWRDAIFWSFYTIWDDEFLFAAFTVRPIANCTQSRRVCNERYREERRESSFCACASPG